MGDQPIDPEHEALKRYILDKREDHLRAIEQKPFSYVPPLWGVSMQEAADALAYLVMPVMPEPIGDSSDGINPCGYGELTPYLLGKEDFIRDEEK